MSRMLVLTEAELRRIVGLDLSAIGCVEEAFAALATRPVAMPPILRLDIPEQSFFNQFSFLPGGVAVFASPPVDSEPGDDSEYTGPFFGVWEAEGPNAIAFSVRHATYSATVSVTGFEEMWGTGTISADGNSMEVNRTFAEAKTDGGEEYRHSRPATFTRQQLRRNP